uniref:Uncharacterized protein n=1 Tax=Myotis myotis TaxID=51298 RepID=A0A7J7TTL9_MYOMY|nr:hypothetical protein mMyoMyo1_008923 [Myotis myotis]
MGPGCPEEPTMRGRQNKRVHFASFPVFRQRSGAPRGIHGWRGPLPWGPLAARAPISPRNPALPAPAPPAQGPARSDSRSRGIRPYCPRGARRARPGSWAVPVRAPTGLGEQEPGAPRKLSPRRRRCQCPPDVATLGVSFFFSLPILMGRKVTAYFAFINSHHNNKNPGANGSQRARPAAGGGQEGPPRLAPTPGTTQGHGAGGADQRCPRMPAPCPSPSFPAPSGAVRRGRGAPAHRRRRGLSANQ